MLNQCPVHCGTAWQFFWRGAHPAPQYRSDAPVQAFHVAVDRGPGYLGLSITSVAGSAAGGPEFRSLTGAVGAIMLTVLWGVGAPPGQNACLRKVLAPVKIRRSFAVLAAFSAVALVV